ncbi:MAG: transglutaminase domain-containing protein [Lachnospira sp.]
MKKTWYEKRELLISILIAAAVFIVLAVQTVVEYNSRIYTSCDVEAGTEVVLSDFFKKEHVKASFVKGYDEFDTSVPDEYHLKIKSGVFSYDCTLNVVDTVAPEAEVKKVSTNYEVMVDPMDFFEEIKDSTKVTASFEKEPDYKTFGDQNITVKLVDLGGNVSKFDTTLTISPIVTVLKLEAGSASPVLSDFLFSEKIDATLVTDMNTVNMHSVGSYPVDVDVDGHIYTSVVKVVDTVAPVIQFVDPVKAFYTSELSIDDFIASAKDETSLSMEFVTKPDYTLDTQKVTIHIEDEGGNTVEHESTLNLVKDTVPPVISGTSNIYVKVGSSISYKNGVVVSDNCDKNITFSVDSSKVNVNEVGTYSATYSATDRAGNTATKTINVVVSTSAYSQAQLNEAAEKILAEIINDSMTDREKLTAIYVWIQSHIGYNANATEYDDVVKTSYLALTQRYGNCYYYACAAQALLTSAGIDNMMIKKIPDSYSHHYWNLVDIGEGWYHFDTTPRKDKTKFNYVTDAWLKEYSDAHNNSHNYDRSAYPVIQ